MFCVKCGTENPDRARFCEQCGATLRTEGSAARDPGFPPEGAYQAGQAPLASVQRRLDDLARKHGFFTEFVNMLKNYTNFTARTTVRGYWMAVLVNIIVEVALYVIALAAGAAGAYGFAFFIYVLNIIYSLALLCPGIAITVRRLRDAGRPWPWIFIAFVPLAGAIVLIIMLCGRSVPDDGTPVV